MSWGTDLWCVCVISLALGRAWVGVDYDPALAAGFVVLGSGAYLLNLDLSQYCLIRLFRAVFACTGLQGQDLVSLWFAPPCTTYRLGLQHLGQHRSEWVGGWGNQ